MTPTIPTVRSRLSAAIVAFVSGFGLANYAIFMVPAPDRVLWMVVAGMLMATSAWGVMVADSPGRLSMWAVLGVEAFFVLTLIPLLWIVSLAMSDEAVPTSLWPEAWTTGAFGALVDDAALVDAAQRSLASAGLATAVGAVVALPLSVVLARTRWRFGPVARAAVVMVVLAPTTALAVGAGDLVVRLGGPFAATTPRVALAQLVVTVPFAVWVLTSAMRGVPWTLAEAVAVDGGGARTVFFRVLLPTAGPAIGVGLLLTFLVAAQDLALATSVTGPSSTTLPVLLLDRAGEPGQHAAVAAVGLCWTAPVALLALVAPRVITRLLGGSPR
ncbi:MAG: hypothetical protein QM621_12410 [Aeromicrobium sp.]|uniref:ABC transporter permease n=1 Tax=Aeromicrobium sp. TaxID=1871063 RepID=UPI0039E612F4